MRGLSSRLVKKFSERADRCRQSGRTGYFKRLVVGSGDAIRRPEVRPRPGQFRAVESGVVPASLSPGIGAFSIRGNS